VAASPSGESDAAALRALLAIAGAKSSGTSLRMPNAAPPLGADHPITQHLAQVAVTDHPPLGDDAN
jgi:hypothetical protein